MSCKNSLVSSTGETVPLIIYWSKKKQILKNQLLLTSRSNNFPPLFWILVDEKSLYIWGIFKNYILKWIVTVFDNLYFKI